MPYPPNRSDLWLSVLVVGSAPRARMLSECALKVPVLRKSFLVIWPQLPTGRASTFHNPANGLELWMVGREPFHYFAWMVGNGIVARMRGKDLAAFGSDRLRLIL